MNDTHARVTNEGHLTDEEIARAARSKVDLSTDGPECSNPEFDRIYGHLAKCDACSGELIRAIEELSTEDLDEAVERADADEEAS